MAQRVPAEEGEVVSRGKNLEPFLGPPDTLTSRCLAPLIPVLLHSPHLPLTWPTTGVLRAWSEASTLQTES